MGECVIVRETKLSLVASLQSDLSHSVIKHAVSNKVVNKL